MKCKFLNSQKLLILHTISKHGAMKASEILQILIVSSVEDIETNGLKGTLYQMVAEGILDYCDKKYAITDKGENYLRSEIENLKLILSYLTDSETVSNDKKIPKKILVTLNSIIGLKTIPYDASILINQSGSEEKFFELKENGIYHFDGRGLGKTLARESNDEYDYTRHAALFISNGIIRFVGLISSYCNASKDMKMNEIIQLSKPISVFDIRNHVKQNFNQSQQKQGFYDNDAKKFVELIKLHY